MDIILKLDDKRWNHHLQIPKEVSRLTIPVTRTKAKNPAKSKARNKPGKRVAQLPIRLTTGGKTDVRSQFAALCWRIKDGAVQVCLVTSRGSGRWILPKGWPMHKQTPAQAAATEAWEEAGVTGKPIDTCLGVYSYLKPLDDTVTPVLVMVYPVKVKKVHSKWPERKQRKRRWLHPKKAAKRLSDPGLAQIVATFDPRTLTET